MSLKLEECHTRIERWQAKRQMLQEQLRREHDLLEKNRQKLADIKAVVQLLQYVSQETTKASELQAATLATMALQETFKDQELTLLIEHKNYRGHPGVEFKLRDEIKAVEGVD